jgi:nicotinate-nucleotide adenylyltransferase
MGVVNKLNIGIMGGTFDPIHNGHLAVAEEVRNHLSLAQVLFIPAGQPWLKVDTGISAVEHRVAMTRLAIADKPYFELSTIELEQSGPSYTVETLGQLHTQVSADDELFFILGWDNLGQLPQWKEPARLIKLCKLVAVPRPGYPLPDISALESVIPGLTARLIVMDEPQIDISASEIRKRVAQGLSIRHLVPAAVDDYIRQNGLYLTDS